MRRGFITQRGPEWAPLFVCLGGLLLSLLALAGSAFAHVSEGGLRHEIVVEERIGGTTIWVRVPLPVVFGDAIADAARDRAPFSTEFLYLEKTGTGSRYRVDMTALEADDSRFSVRLGRALQISRGDQVLQPVVTRWRLSQRRPDRPFNSPWAARTALNRSSTGLDPVFGQAVVEYELKLPVGTRSLSLEGGVPRLVLPPSVDFDTQIKRHAVGERPVVIAQAGQLDQPVMLPRPIWLGYILIGIIVATAVAGLILVLIASLRPDAKIGPSGSP